MSAKKRRSEQQAALTDADTVPFGLHLKPADIAPPVTFRCRRCDTERLWTEQECSGCRSQGTKAKAGAVKQ